jgi:bifunctional ADP-heptose synthase (sugar kinase/adenylyltransferase)
MTEDRLAVLLHDIARARIGIVGDFCVDTYCMVDPGASRPSLETGLMTRPVRAQRSSLGGAGNIAANLRAIGVGRVEAFAVAGDDSLGADLARLLKGIGVGTGGLCVQGRDWQTHCYFKPIIDGVESNRLDYGVFNSISPESEGALLDSLAAALPGLDILIINQQFERGLHSAGVISGVNRLLAGFPAVVGLVDCRNLAEAYPAGLHKLNDLEAARLCGIPRAPNDAIARKEALASAARLSSKWKHPVFVTRGRQGCIVADGSGTREIPGIRTDGEIDTVGAGDSMVSGIAACLAIGSAPAEAASFGNLVAGVTVRKLQQTGTATPDEIRALHRRASYMDPD